jgi:hypothetical protein
MEWRFSHGMRFQDIPTRTALERTANVPQDLLLDAEYPGHAVALWAGDGTTF